MRRLALWTAAVGLVSVVAVAVVSCGGSSSGAGGTTTGTPSGYVITISNMAYAPLDLSVPPGGTVTVVNRDPFVHSVTSEASAGQYTPGAVNGVSFDTGQFTGQKTFTIPANATAGTVVPFFCTFHRAAMATPNGSITVDASAQPNAPGASAPSSTPQPY